MTKTAALALSAAMALEALPLQVFAREPFEPFTIRYEADEAASGTMEDQQVTIDTDQLSENLYQMENETFEGWLVPDTETPVVLDDKAALDEGWCDGIDLYDYTDDEDIITLTALFVPEQLKVYLDPANGQEAADPVTIKDDKITLPENPYRNDGYLFDGWSFEADGKVIEDDTLSRKEVAPYLEDGMLHLYAIWKEDDTEKLSEDLVQAPQLSGSLKSKTRQLAKADDPGGSEAEPSASEGDGQKIENVRVQWIDQSDPEHVTLKPSGNSDMQLRMRLDVAVSGQNPYQPGDLAIEIPQTVFDDRSGKPIGTLSLSVPSAPSKNAAFAYTETDDTYILTNTKQLPAAASFYFEFTLKGLTPSEIKDLASGYTSDPFTAKVTLETKNGKTLVMVSNKIDAKVDTESKVTSASLKADSTSFTWPESWPAKLKPENADDYVYVDWYANADVSGNQHYRLSFKNDADSSVPGTKILGVRCGSKITDTESITVSDDMYATGPVGMVHVYAAYPKSGLKDQSEYIVSDKVTYTLTDLDDGIQTSASASASARFYYAQLGNPSGNFTFNKKGGYEKPYGMNALQKGREQVLDYDLSMTGFQMPWTLARDAVSKPAEGADPDTSVPADPYDPSRVYDLSDFGQRAVSYVITDKDLFMASGTSAIQLAGNEYGYRSLSLDTQTLYGFRRYTQSGMGYHSSNSVFGSITYGKVEAGQFGYYPESSLEDYPDMEVYSDGVHYGTFSVAGNRAFNGASFKGNRLVFAQDVNGFEIRYSSKAAALQAGFSLQAVLKPEGTVKKIVDEQFALRPEPSSLVTNKAGMQVFDEDGQLCQFESSGADRLTSASMKATMSKSMTGFVNDPDHSLVRLHYRVQAYEQTNLSSMQDYREAEEAGTWNAQTSGKFFDLLPEGVVMDEESISLRPGDQIRDIQQIRNWRGSGRTMLIVTADLDPDPVMTAGGLADRPTMSFDAAYSWQSMKDYGKTLTNYSAFASTSGDIGTIRGYMGEPDDPLYGNNLQSLDAVKGASSWITGLDKSIRGNAFLYAKDVTTVYADTAADVNLTKKVSSGNGIFTDGLDDDAPVNVYPGQTYTYRLRNQTGLTTQEKGIVLYDALDCYKPGTLAGAGSADLDDETWKGTLVSIDTHQLESIGIAPVIYWSDNELTLWSKNSPGFVTDAPDTDITNSEIWKVFDPETTDLSQVRSIAIDCSKAADGTDFVLDKDRSLVVAITMQAPETVPEDWYDENLGPEGESGVNGGAHAYNNVSMKAVMITEDGSESDEQLIRQDYTKVGLKAFELPVKKVWDDADDQDGKRPETITVHLMADGTDTGKTVALNDANEWQATFGKLPYYKEGKRISYSVTESADTGELAAYKTTVKMTDGVMVITNTHTPETRDIQGSKIWKGDDETTRPESVQIALYRDGELYSTRKVFGPDWSYTFAGLPVYRDHGTPIDWRVKETGYIPGYVSSIEGDDVINTWHPYGDVVIQKHLENATAAAEENGEFVFEVIIYGSDGSISAKTYDWASEDGRTGTVESGGTVMVKGNKSLTIKDVPSEGSWSVRERKTPGFAQTSMSNATGTLKAGETVHVDVTNTYSSRGKALITVSKALTGQPLEARQFRFELLDEEGRQLRTTSNINDGTATFGALGYTEADDGKTFHYTVREISTGQGGMTYSDKVVKVDVTVTDNGNGTMKTDVQYEEDPVFENTYHASGKTTISVWKQIKGAKVEDGQFTFVLKDANGNELATAVNDADGKASFDALEYTEQDVGKDFRYIVTEKNTGEAGVIYDDNELYFDVHVEDNRNGTLGITQGFSGSANDPEMKTPVFINRLEDGYLQVEKRVDGQQDPAQEFEFMIEATDPAGEPMDGKLDFERVQLEAEGEASGDTEVDKSEVQKAEETAVTPRRAAAADVNVEPAEAEEPETDPMNAEAAETEEPGIQTQAEGDQYTITYEANGGYFGTEDVTRNKVTYEMPSLTEKKIVKTPNINDEGVASGTYSINMSDTQTVTIPGAKSLNIEVWYSTESTTYDWLAIYGSGITPTQYNYSQSVSGKLGNGRATTKENATKATFTVPGDTAQFYFRSDDSGNYYGYYAIVTPGRSVISGSYNAPENMDPSVVFDGWSLSQDGEKTDIGLINSDQTVYAVWKASTIESQGTEGTVRWILYENGTLYFEPVDGIEGTMSGDRYGNHSWHTNKNAVKRIKSSGKINVGINTKEQGLFRDFKNLVDISGVETWNVSGNMSYMFQSCSSLSDISPLAAWNATPWDMKYMFNYCTSLSDLSPLSTWRPNLRSCYDIFANCSAIESISPLKNWKLSYGWFTDMFKNCSSLTDISSVSTWDLNGATNLHGMFEGCKKLTDISPLSNWDLSTVTNVSGMFAYTPITDLSPLSTWDVSNITTFGSRYNSDTGSFQGCSQLTDLSPIANWDLKKASDFTWMFNSCTNLADLTPLSNWNVSNVTTTQGMFGRCVNLTDLSPLANWNYSKITNMSSMFAVCPGLTSLAAISNWNTENVSDMSAMFSGCSGLTDIIGLIDWKTDKLTNVSSMFKNCSGLIELSALSKWSMGQVTNMSSMFNGCSNLNDLQGVKNWNTSKVTSMETMFSGCSSLTNLSSLAKWDVSSVRYMNGLFMDCSALISLSGLENWDVSQVRYFGDNNLGLFMNCKSLTDVSALKDWTLSNAADLRNTLNGCSSLTSVESVSSWEFSTSPALDSFFADCANLAKIDLSNWKLNSDMTASYLFKGVGTSIDDGCFVDLSGCSVPNNSSYSYIFERSRISKIIIGESWNIVGGANYWLINFPNPHLADDVYSGKWCREEDPDVGYSTYDIRKMYEANPGSTAGTWIWQKKPTSYTVEFNGNGGQGSMPDMKADIATPVTLPENRFYWFDHDFTGWSKTTPASELMQPGDKVSLSDTAGSTVTLYANWQASKNEVDFTNGQASFKLHANEAARFKLPAGGNYRVWEKTPDGWTLVQSSGTTGTIKPAQTATATFMNRKTPDTKTFTLKAYKAITIYHPDGSLSAQTATTPGRFSFELLDEKMTVLQTVANDAKGSVVFDPVTVTVTEKTELTYYIREVKGDEEGMSYDTSLRPVKVTVSPDEETIIEGNDVAITNEYTPPTQRLEITKTVTGQGAPDKLFTFKTEFSKDGDYGYGIPPLDPVNDPYRLGSASNGSLIQIKAGQKIEFMTLPRDVTVKVTEVDIPAGYTCTSDITQEAVMTEDRTLAFTNVYEPSPAIWIPEATKVLEGAELAEGQFTFELTDDKGKIISRATNLEDGRVLFDEMTFDAPGTWSYTMRELNSQDPEIVYDGSEKKIVVTITDDGTGVLKALWTADGKAEVPVFTNRTKPGSLSLTKKVTGSVRPDVLFSFGVRLTAPDGTPATIVATDGKEVTDGDVIQLKADETIAFDDVPAGLVYQFVELETPGWKQVSAESMMGTIRSNEKSEAVITNEYAPSGMFTPTAYKQLVSQNLEAGQFEFVLMDEEGNEIDRAKNDASGLVEFTSMKLDAANIGKTRIYRMQEIDKGGQYVYDATVYTVKMMVIDDGKGNLVPQVDYNGNSQAVFVNQALVDMPLSGLAGTSLMLLAAGLVLAGSIGAIYWRKRKDTRPRGRS